LRIRRLLDAPGKTETERFWDTYEEMDKEAKTLHWCLDGHSRSKLWLFMLSMRKVWMLKKEDLVGFSTELQNQIFPEENEKPSEPSAGAMATAVMSAAEQPTRQPYLRFHVRPSDAMKLTAAALILLIALLPAGCTSTVTRQALMRKATHYSLTPQPDITYYCGSQGSFDFFYIQPVGATTFRRAHRLRVSESENAVSDRFGYTTDRGRWRVLVGADRREQDFRPNRPPLSTPGAATPSATPGAAPAPAGH
jgi:hypothetical protein